MTLTVSKYHAKASWPTLIKASIKIDFKSLLGRRRGPLNGMGHVVMPLSLLRNGNNPKRSVYGY